MQPFDEFRGAVRANEPLAPLTWFRLGGPADFLARPGTADELTAMVRRCAEEGLPWHVLAGGSNVLVRDEGVRGLVLHLESPSFSDVRIEGPRVVAGSAVPLTALISQTARAGLAGLETLTGIPGTVGGAVRGNSGGRQGAIGQFVRRATVLEPDGQIRTREQDDLIFSYRRSNLDDCVILSVEMELEPDDPESVVRRMRRIWIVKKENQPYGHQSAGCIFKNPTPEVSAGTLIDQAGLSGKRIGEAEISDRHANYIVADPGATVADVLELIDFSREEVLRKFGYELELQIQIW
ncbi:UDP-N-acetylmuramate dehydrogenase [Tautonia sociabilis]|uniref:UDP-N-acetylenolpyruvoylglucosamine reductase n=1 Tax=Tautonia sociabilis TaxID=2080755 RepID=A0A432MQB2_9BACT|nr:UDP-N-acetylmuramate dehydrogenase [Tautonia sociabilis]RUL89550.1 UDP-N-acetylmuramate dehydrogenase [Tautonia sociabilis]